MLDLLFAVTQPRVLATASSSAGIQAPALHASTALSLLTVVRLPGSFRAPQGELKDRTQSSRMQGDDWKKLGDPENQAVLTALLQEAQPSTKTKKQNNNNNMMSAIETGTSVYQPAQLLNWVYMSLQDTQGGAFDAFKAESDTSPHDMSKRSAADLSSNYLNNFFHLRSEVGFKACYAVIMRS